MQDAWRLGAGPHQISKTKILTRTNSMTRQRIILSRSSSTRADIPCGNNNRWPGERGLLPDTKFFKSSRISAAVVRSDQPILIMSDQFHSKSCRIIAIQVRTRYAYWCYPKSGPVLNLPWDPFGVHILRISRVKVSAASVLAS